MEQKEETILVTYEELSVRLETILLKNGFSPDKAKTCATLFATNSLEGVSSHGVNRFPRFLTYIRKGYVNPHAEPTLLQRAGNIEQWHGHLGPGPLNALFATHRAMSVASAAGTGIVALQHTNHWMRGGSYGWEAARAGYIFIGWTNTTPNMPAWGGKNPLLGNNPLVVAIPHHNEAIVLDMAMSQYSFGKMEEKKMQHEKLPTHGGYNSSGELTDDPGEIIETWRALPAGYWKGAALSLMLDMLAALLSGGLSTSEIGKKSDEYAVSQVFIAIDPKHLLNFPAMNATVDAVLDDLKRSAPAWEGANVRYPGERVIATRKHNLRFGIPVNRKIWEEELG